MLFRGIVLLALLAAFAASSSIEDVVLRAEAATSACKAAGGAPHPWDPQLLVLCADEHVPLTVVHCPPGTRAANETKGCQSIGGSESDRPAHRRLRRQGSASPNVDRGCENGPGLWCDGYDKLLVCAQDGNQMKILQTVSCSDAGMSCNQKKNTCEKEISCPSGSDSCFRCLQEGSFPDPDDCKRYHVCNATLWHSTDTCGSTYDAVNKACLDGTPCTPTPLKNCEENPGSVAFAKTPYYRVCIPQKAPNKGYTKSVMSCAKDQVFDDNEAKCIYKCPENPEGKRFPDTLDCHKYYECTKESTLTSKSCSAGLGYDSTKKMCVEEANVKECAPPLKIPPTKAPTKAPPRKPVDCPLFTVYRQDLGYCAWGLFG